VNRYVKLALIALTVLAADQSTKYLAVTQLTKVAELEGEDFFTAHHLMGRLKPAVQVTPFWEFRYAENPGAAWSFMAGTSDSVRVPFFYVVAIAACFMIVYFYRRARDDQKLQQVALAMVLGGAAGNTLDRLIHGYVVDFIAWHYRAHYWPTFNVADSFVCVGVALLMLEGVITKQPNQNDKTSKNDVPGPATPVAEPRK
jgi:signal peptidase II